MSPVAVCGFPTAPRLESGAGARAWFHRLANGRECPELMGELAAWLGTRLATAVPLVSWEEIETWGGSSESADDHGACFMDGRTLAFHAPLGLTEGAWLQHLGRSGIEQSPPVAALFGAYLALLGDGESRAPAAAYRAGLLRSACMLAPVPFRQFAQDPRVGVPALDFASLQLALSLHPQAYLPELIGYTLAYARDGAPWRLSALAAPERRARLGAVGLAAERALDGYLAGLGAGEGSGHRNLILRGAGLYREAAGNYRAQLFGEISRVPSIAVQAVEIFRRKARLARGYHGRIRLGEKSLDQWFAEEPFDGAGFMATLVESGFGEGPRGERRLDRAAGFGGPMFGVFDPEELAVIGAWLDECASAEQLQRPCTAITTAAAEISARPEARVEVSRASAALELPRSRNAVGSVAVRALFHRLLQRERFPGAGREARGWVDRSLALAGRRLRRSGGSPQRFFDYSPGALEDRIEQIHRGEVARYRPRERPRLEREAYVWGIEQFAPAILVDGCWLRGFGEAAEQDDRMQRLLLRTHADELGAGCLAWNHPAIYRRLLESQGIGLPPVADEAFAFHPAFLDAAFDLPVFLLGISCYPQTYLAEILGLNLAIELSGLGAGYIQLADELRHWGIDPLIVELHLSIDNLASGHSAMAVEAIQLYLERVRINGGEPLVQEQWRRIWTGYLSLSTVTGRFKRALLLGFCRRFLPRRIAAWLGACVGRPAAGVRQMDSPPTRRR